MPLTVEFAHSDKLSKIMAAEKNMSNGTFVWCDQTERLYIKMKDKLIGITPGKRRIKKLSCISCGSPFIVPETGSICKCEYCGAVYDIDNFDMDLPEHKGVEE